MRWTVLPGGAACLAAAGLLAACASGMGGSSGGSSSLICAHTSGLTSAFTSSPPSATDTVHTTAIVS